MTISTAFLVFLFNFALYFKWNLYVSDRDFLFTLYVVPIQKNHSLCNIPPSVPLALVYPASNFYLRNHILLTE